jgi:hypothetical protein
MPNRFADLMTLQAISPRLAIRILDRGVTFGAALFAFGERELLQKYSAINILLSSHDIKLYCKFLMYLALNVATHKLNSRRHTDYRYLPSCAQAPLNVFASQTCPYSVKAHFEVVFRRFSKRLYKSRNLYLRQCSGHAPMPHF